MRRPPEDPPPAPPAVVGGPRPARGGTAPEADATAPPEPTLRARKRAAARAKVVDVAIGLFAQRGYAAVSVDEICSAAEVSPRSFFRYFAAKQDVLLEPMREMADRMEAAIVTAPADFDDAEVMAHALRTLGAHVLEQRGRLSRFFRVAAETDAVRASPVAQLAERERAVTDHLLRRRGQAPPAEWPTRLLVARSVAAFRVWLDDVRTTEVVDPLAHLDRILAAP